MLEGNRIILSNANAGDITLTDAPEGLFNLEYGMPRSEKFYGVFPKYSGKLGFVGDGKIYIDDILDTYTKHEIITFTWKVKDPITAVYEIFLTGIINLLKNKRELVYTYCNFEGTSIEMKLNSRMDIEVPYNRQVSIDGTVLPGITYDFVNLKCQGVSSDIITQSIYPHEFFESILQQILDIDYPVLYSPIFGRTNNGYTDDGELSKKMIAKGTFLRLITDDLYDSLNNAFEYFNKILPLGLGFAKDDDDRDIVVIAEREYFFQSIVVMELDDNKISNLEKEFGEEFSYNQYEVGFSSKVKKEVLYGLSEYIRKSSYSTDSIMEGKKLDLINKARGDGVAINDIIDNFQGADIDESDYDEDIFIICSKDEAGAGYDMINLKAEEYDSYEGIEDDPGLHYNFDLSPARILIDNYGKWLNIGLQDLTGYLMFNKAETLSTLRTLKTGDTASIYEKTNILLSVLETPIMTGNIYSFDYPFTEAEIITLKENPYGQVTFWDYSEKKPAGGWIKEPVFNPTEGKASFQVYEAITLAELLGLELNENGGFALNEDNTFVELET